MDEVRLINRQPNQIKCERDINFLKKNEQDILSRVTHVMDCECFHVDKRHYLREVSVFNLKTFKVDTYHIFYPYLKYNGTINYQIKKCHGLPLVRVRRGNYISDGELLSNLRELFDENSFVAYKGGQIERYVTEYLNVKSVNLEIFGCEKYEDLLLRYNLKSRWCDQHLFKTHCSRFEVMVFGFFIFEKLLKLNDNLFKLYRDVTIHL